MSDSTNLRPPIGLAAVAVKGSDMLNDTAPAGLKGYEAPPSAPKQETRDLAEEDDWLRIAMSAYDSSTSYLDTNYRKTWDDSLRAFNNQHASDSKYNQASYEKRSRLFRPKVRSIIRKNEAAAAAAFFSSQDVTSVLPTDQSNPIEVASAEVNKALLQHRLTKSIPWFMVLLGGLQDAQNVGVACAHIYWDYKERPKTDKPCVDLIPVENLRISPSSDWSDPINSSPYVIHLMPLHMMDVRSRMKSGEWYAYGDSALKASTQTKYDSTRAARLSNREDPFDPSSKSFTGYETCWVQRHIHRRDGEDWEFYTLGDFALLSAPRPLGEVVFHGKRPYVMGCAILEAHKLYPSSVPTLGKDLQNEANEVANQRIDNVKFVLNKKWFVKRGAEVEVQGLVRNVPGGVVMMGNPNDDVREINWPDVTASAYEEQSRIDNDMNDLLGNFSAGQVMADHGINGPARNMALLGQSSATLVEYMLRTYVETFVQPVLRQILLLEQNYETDQVVLAVAAKQAKIFQRFGMDSVTDELLEQELTLSVNVGMGATDPQMKLQKFVTAIHTYIEMLKDVPPGVNMEEVGKEIFGALGYQDGSRFLSQENPQLIQMGQKLQAASQEIQQLQMKVKDRSDGHVVKLKTTEANNQTKLQAAQLHEDHEDKRSAVTHLHAIMEAEKSRTHDLNQGNLDRMHERVLHRLSAENHMREQKSMKTGDKK